MPTAGSLDAIEPFIGEVLKAAAPGRRKKLMDKLMRFARRANAARIAANVEPEGGAMAKRKPRKSRGGKGKRGKMFRRIGKTASLKIRTSPEEGELSFVNAGVERTAATHHFGLTGFVGKTRSGRIIRTKYEARRLLGHGEEQAEYLDEVLRHFAE